MAALAANPQIRPLTPIPAAKTAIRLRPSLAGADPRALPAGDTGLLLGDLQRPAGRGPALFASWEDTLTAFMAPRSGKTTALSIPYVLSAPGAVVATSNKADLWAATAQLRAGSGSTVWLFDPQRITGASQRLVVEPAGGAGDGRGRPPARLPFRPHRAMTAAAVTCGARPPRTCCARCSSPLRPPAARCGNAAGGWPTPGPRSPPNCSTRPASALSPRACAARSTAPRKPATASTRPPGRRPSASTTRTSCCWVTPPARSTLPVFDPAAFAASRDTLYLLTEARSAAAPLIAALTDAVMRAGRRQAERAGGRLDPPMVVVLDEAANICRIADLPELYSHLGSRGMVPVTILQSYQQGVAVWGEPGMAALWGASTKKVIGAGIDDPRHARDLATLVGQHDVPVTSVSYGDGRASRQVSLRRQEILEAADIRALPPGSALLLATGARPALISLRPWYTGPHARPDRRGHRRAEAAMRRAAQNSAEPPGPPARAALERPGTRS